MWKDFEMMNDDLLDDELWYSRWLSEYNPSKEENEFGVK